MIPIKVQNKSYKIKSIPELTTQEFIELQAIEELDFVKYIAWQTKLSMDDAFFAITSKTVEKAIGKVPDVSKLKKPDRSDIDYNLTIETVGQRHQVEGCGLDGFPLLVFVLAVSQARSNNIDDVNKLRDQYLAEPFTEILPAGFFFFRKLQPGKSFGQKCFEKLQSLTSTQKQKKQPESVA